MLHHNSVYRSSIYNYKFLIEQRQSKDCIKFVLIKLIDQGNLIPNKGGAHLGRDKTVEKITSRFYWKDMISDIREFVRVCDDCQRNNDVKFSKTNAALHPIPVTSKVWYQVGYFNLCS